MKERKRYYRRIIRITAEHSPNVKFARAQQQAGIPPTNEIILPGVLSWADYAKRRATWDIVRQTIGLDAKHWKGADQLLYPPHWLAASMRAAVGYRVKRLKRIAQAIGIDPAEGGDKTTMTAVDELGVIEQVSKRTPDTSVIRREAVAFGRLHNVPAENWAFDAGGGGKQIADELRANGYNVRTVAFGEKVTPPPRVGMQLIELKIDEREARYAYVNRRAQMYGQLRNRINPQAGYDYPFGIPEEYEELIRQMALIPLRYDGEGRMKLPPKNKRDPKSNEITLIQIIGHSPDELDSLVLAVHAMTHEADADTFVAGGF